MNFWGTEKDEAFISAEATLALTVKAKGPVCLQRQSPQKQSHSPTALCSMEKPPGPATQLLRWAVLTHLRAQSPAACSPTGPPGGSGWTGCSQQCAALVREQSEVRAAQLAPIHHRTPPSKVVQREKIWSWLVQS